MRMRQLWWSVLMAAMLGGLLGVTGVAAAGEQFFPVLSTREGALRSFQIPLANGYLDYVTLLNARDGGLNGVKLVWEECETVWDVSRGVECYERLKTKGSTGANVWACSEQDMVPAGEAAMGYICASFHGTGTDFPLLQDILTYVYARARGLVLEAMSAR